MTEEVIIREYQKEDRDSIRKIAWDTSFIGEPADLIFEDKEILADYLTQYFTDYEPESCFVAQVNNRVVGYLIGSRNASTLGKVFRGRIFPYLLLKSFFSGTLFKKGNLTLILSLILSLFKGEFKMPNLHNVYPATLHINLEKGFRAQGIGSKLMNRYLNYLADKRVSGVYLATMSEKAAGFFKKHGFGLLHTGARSYFRYVCRKDIPVYILGKKTI